MIVAFFIGAITGWLLSMPIGPVNTAVISRTLKYSFKFGIAVGVGAALMDVIYCGGAAQINQFLVESPVINLFFELAGFAALLVLGIRQLSQKTLQEELNNNSKEKKDDPGEWMTSVAMKRMRLKKKSLAGPFTIGVLLYATNVMAVPEWIIISGLWRSWGVLGTGVAINALFALGAGVGTVGWFTVLVRWISRHHRGFKPATLRKINMGTSIAMFVFSLYFAYAIIFETHWPEVKSHFKENTGRIIDSMKP
jgi:L-lysine exporter family protein LysE/ArgO